MNSTTLAAAETAAREFLKRAKALRESGDKYVIVGTRESGAVKRASLDLTRALADMRRPG